MSQIAQIPKPPYYAVIFTSTRTPDDNGYSDTADRMVEFAQQQPDFISKKHAEHLYAQRLVR